MKTMKLKIEPTRATQLFENITLFGRLWSCYRLWSTSCHNTINPTADPIATMQQCSMAIRRFLPSEAKLWVCRCCPCRIYTQCHCVGDFPTLDSAVAHPLKLNHTLTWPEMMNQCLIYSNPLKTKCGHPASYTKDIVCSWFCCIIPGTRGESIMNT